MILEVMRVKPLEEVQRVVIQIRSFQRVIIPHPDAVFDVKHWEIVAM